MKSVKLDEAMKNVFPDYRIGEVDFKGRTCFGDFDGVKLQFLNMERPYPRCFLFHSLVSRKYALHFGWIDKNELKELDNDDMWSDESLDEKTRKIIAEWRVVVCS